MNLELLMQCRQTNVTKQPLVLAVDDDEDSLLLLTEILRPMRCSFITATHGEAALLIAQAHQPKLILLDVMLPDLNGAEVVQRLRQNPQTRKIPVIAVTALAGAEDRKSLIVGGCDDYITKPYMLEDLEAIIYRHLNQISFVA